MTISVILEILVLWFTGSYVMYVFIGIIANISTNLIVSNKVNKYYPYLKTLEGSNITKEKKKEIFKNLYAVSMYKINSTIVRSTDSIVIAAFVSVSATGLYSNYHMIVAAIITMVKLFFTSITASIGNLFVLETKEKSMFIFRCLSYFSFWLYGFCSICLWNLFNPFIVLWLGEDYLLNNIVVFLIVIDFLMDGFMQVPIAYKDACGLFWKGKYRPVFTAILNIIISFTLAPVIGISGVLLGTIISRLLTTWWFEPWLVHKHAFSASSKLYYVRSTIAFLVVFSSAILVQFLSSPFNENNLVNFCVKIIICIIVPNFIFFVIFRKTEEFKYVSSLFKKTFASLKKRKTISS